MKTICDLKMVKWTNVFTNTFSFYDMAEEEEQWMYPPA